MFKYARESQRLLGVDHTHTVAQIKAAFRACVKKYHPDVLGNTPGSVRYFQHINRVYSELLQYKSTHPDAAPNQAPQANRASARPAPAHRDFNRQHRAAQTRPAARAPRKESRPPSQEQLLLKKMQKMQKGASTVDPLVAEMGIEALIMRCEFSDNYYVKREAIKALIFKGTPEAVKGILYLQKSSDNDAREIIDELLFQSDDRFKRMMENDGGANPFFAWVSKLVNGIVRVFDSSVRPTTHP